jgi:hypothetical protein
MVIYHKWEVNGKKYHAVYDETYETRGSYAYDTEEETRAAEENEISKLESGKWVVLGVMVYEKKPHCDTCQCQTDKWTYQETDSLWGIVIENSQKAIEEFVKVNM